MGLNVGIQDDLLCTVSENANNGHVVLTRGSYPSSYNGGVTYTVTRNNDKRRCT